MRWRYTLAAAIALIACGCFDSGHASAPTAVSQSDSSDAIVLLSPFNGTVNLAGGPALPAGASPHPAANTHVLVLNHGRVIARVVTDKHGWFTFKLPAGRYALQTRPLAPVEPAHFTAGRTHQHQVFWMSVK